MAVYAPRKGLPLPHGVLVRSLLQSSNSICGQALNCLWLQVEPSGYALVVSTENITQNWYPGNNRAGSLQAVRSDRAWLLTAQP